MSWGLSLVNGALKGRRDLREQKIEDEERRARAEAREFQRIRGLLELAAMEGVSLEELGGGVAPPAPTPASPTGGPPAPAPGLAGEPDPLADGGVPGLAEPAVQPLPTATAPSRPAGVRLGQVNTGDGQRGVYLDPENTRGARERREATAGREAVRGIFSGIRAAHPDLVPDVDYGAAPSDLRSFVTGRVQDTTNHKQALDRDRTQHGYAVTRDGIQHGQRVALVGVETEAGIRRDRARAELERGGGAGTGRSATAALRLLQGKAEEMAANGAELSSIVQYFAADPQYSSLPEGLRSKAAADAVQEWTRGRTGRGTSSTSGPPRISNADAIRLLREEPDWATLPPAKKAERIRALQASADPAPRATQSRPAAAPPNPARGSTGPVDLRTPTADNLAPANGDSPQLREWKQAARSARAAGYPESSWAPRPPR